MPKIAYIQKGVMPETLALIEWADRTCSDYASRGFNLSLRQLYYQGVSQNLYPNTEASYNRLGRIVSDGRMMGLIDWNHLDDRHRSTSNTGWAGTELPDMAELVRGMENSVAHDLWEGQEYRPEVWVEKDALEQIAERAAAPYRIGFMACKGYMSQSQMWAAGARRFYKYWRDGQRPVVIHLGDHDPSGIDMTRDIEDRLHTFAGVPVEVRRIALNFDQIEEFQPPPNPAKQTDARFQSYAARFGDESWELDALRPEMLIELIQREILSMLDVGRFTERQREEREAEDAVREVADRWDEIQEYLDEHPL